MTSDLVTPKFKKRTNRYCHNGLVLVFSHHSSSLLFTSLTFFLHHPLCLFCLLCLCLCRPVSSSTTTTTKADTIYSHCETSVKQPLPNRTCVYVDDHTDCIPNRNCRYLLTFTPSTKYYRHLDFELLARHKPRRNAGEYAAMGISKGVIMGQDIVVACIRFKDRNIVQLSFNAIEKKMNSARFPAGFEGQLSQLMETSSNFEDGQILCEFSLPYNTSVYIEPFRVDQQELVVFIADGPVYPDASNRLNKGVRLGYHRLKEAFVSPKLSMLKLQIVRAIHLSGKQVALRIHMAFMVITFICLMPNSMLVARFYKESKVKLRIFHRRIWLVIHSITLSIGLVISIAGVIVIGVSIESFNNASRNPHLRAHYIIGTVALGGYVSQMLMGLYIALTEEQHEFLKLVLAVTHWLTGVLTFVLGTVQIFLAPYLMRDFITRYCTLPSIAVLVWAFIYLVIYLTLTILMYKTDNATTMTIKDKLAELAEEDQFEDRDKSKSKSIGEEGASQPSSTTVRSQPLGRTLEGVSVHSIASRKKDDSASSPPPPTLDSGEEDHGKPGTGSSLKIGPSKNRRLRGLRNKVVPVVRKRTDDGLGTKTPPRAARGRKKGLNKDNYKDKEKEKEADKDKDKEPEDIKESDSREKQGFRKKNKQKGKEKDKDKDKEMDKEKELMEQRQRYLALRNNKEDKGNTEEIEKSVDLTAAGWKFMPQVKGQEIVYDEYLMYQHSLANIHPMYNKGKVKDSKRAWIRFPLKIRSNKEYPRTLTVEILIGTFLLISIANAIFLCYTLFPLIPTDDPDGKSDQRSCEGDNEYGHNWMRSLP